MLHTIYQVTIYYTPYTIYYTYYRILLFMRSPGPLSKPCGRASETIHRFCKLLPAQH